MGKKIIGVLGCGKIGSIITNQMIEKGVCRREDIIASVHRDSDCDRIRAFGVKVTTDNLRVITEASIVFVTLKPDSMTDALAPLHGHWHEDTLIISTVTGWSTQHLESAIGIAGIIRTMPNTPVAVGKGVIGWFPGRGVSKAQHERAKEILEKISFAPCVLKEDDLDKITALSGCGPAYVFQFVKYLIRAGARMGLPYAMSRELVLTTIEGSVALMRAEDVQHRKLHPEELTEAVSSPAGATLEGHIALEEHGFGNAILRAVQSAYNHVLAIKRKVEEHISK
ncbi:MAG: pyrroline-5-carboxylate reductase [bacterium]|nr:pyrroline-5-carboxylate reductase [bacterium]